ncbi:mannose-1-phosphate guanylyltransferase [Phormidium sp. CCY1219]|uniref:mannose-1-phosphate guanylyltransferase n=1 Tax=Phormidium sp. CCY1219 TaxID=2886104 RepID=UPI002D1E6238|nr:mannose-1-phosphate guanylyltransferase [Phormidium sp. CCY1219]MEB3829052.1 mannose-1-phosphate guanylyltransferase [Phormidium sp. CCY1219]
MIPVILAGGKGERFWPLSRRSRPKQFLSLDGSGKSLLQATADRLLEVAGGWDGLWVVTNAQIADGIKEQLPELPVENLLVEPQGKDTAPAVAWATLEIARRHGEEAIVGFFPADHWIGDESAYRKTLLSARDLAQNQRAIVTLGIQPTHPATGYGYIEQGESVGTYGFLTAYRVNRFTEKPVRDTAEHFIATGRYSWNSGMFIFKAGVVLEELRTHAQEILDPLAEKGAAAYAELPKTSIDYAVMEKTRVAYVIPTSFGWDDLGDWVALERLRKGDQANLELAPHIGMDTTGAIVYSSSEDDRIVTIGLSDVVVVRDRNVTLVVKKDRTQDIKKVLKRLEEDPQFRSEL